MLNKKGFTLVELLATIAIIGILSGITIMAVSKYQKKATDEVYKNFEKQLKDGTVNYLTSNIGEVPEYNSTKTINSSTLKENGYLDDMVDPIDKSKKCTGTIKVKNKSNITENEENEDDISYENGNMVINTSSIKNLDLEYTVCLVCSQYQSSVCSS